MEKNTLIETCKKCGGFGGKYLDKPKVCENCKGKRCYLCDRRGPYTFYEECNSCWGDGVIKKKSYW